MRRLALAVLAACAISAWTTPTDAATGDRIAISGTQFMVGSQRVWINGANTPWHAWNDFGGKFDAAWWDRHFQKLHDNGINATRVWITCDGEVGIAIDDSGHVTGATPKHWADLDQLFAIAKKRGVYVMATLISFDHFKNNHPHYRRWRAMVGSNANIDAFVNNYVVALVERYKANPFLWSIDLCNEPDWVFENAECGKLPWDGLQAYFANAAAAIHAHSDILVTIGFAMPKYCSNAVDNLGNKVSDDALGAIAHDPRARIDFNSTHHYDWMMKKWPVPFYTTPAAYGLDPNKPALIGECPAGGTAGHTSAEDYEGAFTHGWQGAQGWTSNGVDRFRDLKRLGPATRAFHDRHATIVFPTAGSSAAPAQP